MLMFWFHRSSTWSSRSVNFREQLRDPFLMCTSCISQLYSINDQPCVKISDELTKVRASGMPRICMRQVYLLTRRPLEQNTGDPEAVKLVKQRFGLEEHGAESKWGPTV